MNNTQAELIINSGSRQSRAAKRRLLQELKRQSIDITSVNEFGRHQPLSDILTSIKERSPKLLIVGGGDGTISAVVDGLVGSNIEIGFVPLGTTNNFARSLNIPLDIDGAVRTIRENEAEYVDLGRVDDDYFTNLAGIGLSAQVAHDVTDAAKKNMGRMAYAIVGLRLLLAHKPFMVTIMDNDGDLQMNFETHQLIVANGRYHAGRKIAEGTSLNDRQLTVFALGGRSKIGFIWHIIDFYIGKRKNIAHSSYLIARNIRIETNPKQPIEVDGEVKLHTPVQATVMPKAIKVRYASR